MNNVYGKLYNWYTVSDSRKLCPAGWHIPDDFDWAELITYLGGSDMAGGKMKETGTTHWSLPNTEATNSSGFNGIPGGDRRGAINSVFDAFGTLGRHWSSSQLNEEEAWGYDLVHDGAGIGRNQFNKAYGFSCRCVRD